MNTNVEIEQKEKEKEDFDDIMDDKKLDEVELERILNWGDEQSKSDDSEKIMEGLFSYFLNCLFSPNTICYY